jgi:hypothetical protein
VPASPDDYRPQQEPTLSPATGEDAQRDLDKPAFLRRLKF